VDISTLRLVASNKTIKLQENISSLNHNVPL